MKIDFLLDYLIIVKKMYNEKDFDIGIWLQENMVLIYVCVVCVVLL